MRQIQNLKNLNERLMQSDAGLLSNESREQRGELGPRIRGLLTEEMGDDMRRLDVEQYISRIEDTAKRHITATMQCLRDAANSLRSGRIGEALRAVKKAKSYQEIIARLADIVRRLEQYLLALTRRDIRIERKKRP